MSEENKTIVRRYIEDIWNNGNLEVVNELFAANYVGREPATPGEMRGPDQIRQVIAMYLQAFPDTRWTIEEQIVEGDKVVTRYTGMGTHKGTLMGIAPTGKQATVTGIFISRIADGKIAEEWYNWDTLGLLQQLGVAAAPQQSGS